jgi:hypothetical protein
MDTNEKIIRVLMETCRLLEGKGWNKYTMARNANGQLCSPDSQDAACYCLSGALVKAWRTIDPQNEDFYFPYFEKKISQVLLEKYNYPYTYTRWNDNVATCREDVIKLIHLVITSVLTDSEVSHDAFALRKFAA